MGSCYSYARNRLSGITWLSYGSVKLIKVENPFLGAIYYLMMLAVLTYVVGFTIIAQKGYQEYETLVSSMMLKAKGSAYYDPAATTQPFFVSPYHPSTPPTSSTPHNKLLETQSELHQSHLPPLTRPQLRNQPRGTDEGGQFHLLEYRGKSLEAAAPAAEMETSERVSLEDVGGTTSSGSVGGGAMVFDSNDLVIPAMLSDGMFLATNLVMTPSQSRGLCNGNDDKMELCNCSLGSVELCCQASELTYNGLKTGKCGTDGKYCEVEAWCPLENESKQMVLEHVANWTVMVRIDVNFPKFDVKLSNAGNTLVLGESLFPIWDILGKVPVTYDEVKTKGAVIAVSFYYDCDLNKALSKCKPQINSVRLDKNSSVSSGFNYRAMSKYHVNGVEMRDLTKVSGLRLIVEVSGRAGKFSLVVLSVTLGSGLALLGVSTVVCDIVMQYFLPNRRTYVASKYEEVSDEGLREVKQASDDPEPAEILHRN